MTLSSSNTPLNIYHGIPKGWNEAEIINSYHKLGGLNISDLPEVSEPGAPSWLPDRKNWLQYRAAIQEIAELVQVGDLAAIELAVRYIELNYFGSYSGYLRGLLARRLKQQDISENQARRLVSHFRNLIEQNQCFLEFREYRKLKNHIRNQKQLG